MKKASTRVRLLMATVALPCLAAGAATASHTSTDPEEVGQLSPLIPVPKDAIHAGLAWTPKAGPKICLAMRPSEYVGHHLVEPDGHLSEAFERFVYGGFGFSEGAHGLDESVTKGDVNRDNFVCWNLNHPDAFNDTGEFAIVGPNDEELVTKADFALNAASFKDVGHARGLEYNIFCAGNVALADGRWLFIGGHDKSGNNGIRKLNIFDPATETWVRRPRPKVKRGFLVDPDGAFPALHADPLDEANTDPPHPSDMRYQRWYPTGVVLPNKDVLILSGTDQDTSLGPPGTMFAPCASTTANAACSKVRQAAPEVYSPKLDRTLALENARKLFNMYPRAFVVQTGRSKDDWRVAVVGEVDHDRLPGLRTIGQYDPFAYTGATYFLDVLGARRDRDRNTPAEDHWQFVHKAAIAHDSGASAQLWELNREGHAVAQRVALFGGGCGSVPQGTACNGATVEMIDFQAENPRWQVQEPLIQPASQNNAVALPDGRVVVVGGATGRGPWVNSFHLQMFDPAAGTITPLVETQVARHDHATTALLRDGSVAILGGNATDLDGDVAHLDLGISVAQIYRPPYLFKGTRPVIRSAPKKIGYGHQFRVNVAGGADTIGSVALIRIGPVTHNWDWGNRHVKLWFERRGEGLRVRAPAVPGLAVPGYYMLFVVSTEGVPSVAELVHLDG